MATARLFGNFLLLYLLQVSRGQQVSGNNQDVGLNSNILSLQQQAMQRFNANVNKDQNGGPSFGQNQNVSPHLGQNQNRGPNFSQNQNRGANFNQNPGPNYNFQQQPNFQNGYMPVNMQGNLQQPMNPQGNLQSQTGSIPINVQVMRPQQPTQPDMPPTNQVPMTSPFQGANQGLASLSSLQLASPAKMNGQSIPPQNMEPINIPISQMTNMPLSNTFGDSKNQPSLQSLMVQQAIAPPHNQQVFLQNPVPPQNQLTDAQKQMLVRSLQAQQPLNIQNQLDLPSLQQQPKMAMANNQQFMPLQGQIMSYQPIVTPNGNQPAFIPVQAQPLTAYLQNQPYNPQEDEDASLMALLLSEFQPSSPQYAIASAFASPKKGKSSLKTLIPLIINMLKERNGCGCRNCAWDNGCGNYNEEPKIFGGYSNQKNYSEKTEEPPGAAEAVEDDVEIEENISNANELNNNKKNVVNVDSGEVSEEDDSEYVDDEET